MEYSLANKNFEAYKLGHLYEKRFFQGDSPAIECLNQLLHAALEITESDSGFWHFKNPLENHVWIGSPAEEWSEVSIRVWQEIIDQAYSETSPTLMHYPAQAVSGGSGADIPMIQWPLVYEDQTLAILILFRDETAYLPEALTRIEPLTRAAWQIYRDIALEASSPTAVLAADDLTNWSSYLNQTKDAYFLINTSGIILDCNQGSKALIGLLRTQAIEKNLLKFIYQDDLAVFQKDLLDAPLGETITTRLMTPGGSTKVIEWKFTPHPDVSLRFLMGRDITKVAHAQKVQEKTRSYAEQLIEGLPDGVILINPGGIHLDANPAFLAMTGFSLDELKGKTAPFPYWPEENHETLQASFDKILQGDFEELEVTFKRNDGERFPVIMRPAQLKDSSGQRATIYATVKDITQQKLVLEHLKENEYRFRQLVMNSPLAILIFSEGMIRFCNPAAVHLFKGKQITQFLGKPIQSIFHKADKNIVARMAVLTPDKETRTTEEHIVDAQGNMLVVEVTSHRVSFEGKPAHQAIFRDITERNKALKALQKSEEQHRFLVESVPHVIWTASEPGQIETCNSSALEFLKTTTQDILSQGWIPYVHTDDQETVLNTWAHAATHPKAYRIRYRLGNPDLANWRWVQEDATPMKNAAGKIVRWYGIATDMHEQILAQNALTKREAFLHSLVQSQTTFLVRLNNQGRFQFVNEAFRSRFHAQGPLLGKPAQRLVVPEDDEKLEEALRYCTQHPGQPHSIQIQQYHQQDQVLWVSWELLGLKNEEGSVLEIQGVGNDITQQKKAEQRIEEQRRKLDNITNSVPGVVYQFRMNAEGQINYDYVSDTVHDLFHIPKHKTVDLAKQLGEVSHEQAERVSEIIKSSRKQLKPFKYEVNIRLGTGEYRWFLNQAKPETPAEDGSVRWNGILTDITEQKALKTLLDDTSRIAKVGGWELNIANQMMTWTEETYHIHELKVDTPMKVDTAIGYFTPKHQEIIEEAIASTSENGGSFDVTAQLTTAKGNTLWVRVQGRAIVTQEKVIRLMGTLQDVTIGQEIELRLRESEAILRTSLEHSLVSNVLLDVEGNILFIDERTKGLLGYYTGTVPEITDWFPQFLPKEEIENFEANFARAYGGETVILERQIQYASQPPFWLEIVYRPVMHENGHTAAAVVFSFQNINNRKNAELEVQKLALVAENTDNLIIITDANGYIEWANDAFLDLSGYELENITGHQPGLFMFGSGTDKQVIQTVEEAFVLKQKVKSELQQFTKQGAPYWVELDMEPIRDQNNVVIHFILLQNNITERKEAEKAMEEQNQELKKTNQELDTFVYRVSHDLRAPLVSSLGLIDLTLDESNPEVIKQYLGLQKKSLSKLDNFIKDILNYSRNSRMEITPEEIELKDLIGGIFEQLNYIESYKSIERIIEINHPGGFHSDQRRLNVVLSNLISNALKFSRHHLANAFVKVQVTGDTEWVEILVEDNGQGIPNEHLDNIFKMFYRATDRQSGSGLGLYIVKETIEKLGGTVEVESTLNEGTAFKILLPNLKITPNA